MITDEIIRLQNAKASIKSAIEDKGVSVGDVSLDEYADKIADIPVGGALPIGSGNPHVVNGKWVKPADWDDIESIEIPEGKSELYHLYGNHLSYSFCRLRVYGTALTWARGRVIDGAFVPDGAFASVASGGYIEVDLEQYEDDYSVICVKGTVIQQCIPQAWNKSGMAFGSNYNACLMRYGRMPKGTNIVFSCYTLESDNVLDFAKDLTNTTLTLASAYTTCYNLARWRHEGWNIAANKTTSLASMFNNCYNLIDVEDMDLTGWCSATTTNISSMFNYCYSLTADIILNDWDVTNVTTMASMFSTCYYIQHIYGLETWTEAKKCTATNSMFANTWCLAQKLDVSSWKCGAAGANFTNISSMFSTSSVTEIDISGWNLSKMTTNFTSVFATCRKLKKIKMDGCVWPTAATTFNGIFNTCVALEELELDGWDFSKIPTSATNAISNFVGNCYSLRKFTVKNVVPLSGTSINDNSTTNGSIFQTCHQIRYLDASWIDMNVFSSTYAHLYAFRTLYMLVDFFPPKNISKSFYMNQSVLLSHDSLIRIIDNLIPNTSSTKPVLTLGAMNKAKLTADEYQRILDKGWTYA